MPTQGMLVLTRLTGERICIGDDIIIEVVQAKNGKTKLGVIAPRNVEVDREEVRLARRAFEGAMAK